MTDSVYDLCIVGAGLVGSAAARHASLSTAQNICLVGPSEPQERNPDDSRDIYGCHYDEGRIIRELDPDVTWSHLAVESIKRYRHIEKDSGIQFYNETGFLSIGEEGGEYLLNIQNVITSNAIKGVKKVSNQDIKEKFPYFKFSSNDAGFFIEKNGGHISPRKMVLAQQIAAKKRGCDVIDDVVVKIEEHTSGFLVMTASGREILSRRVLLTTNAFTNLCQLIPGEKKLDLQVAPTCVVLVEISKDEVDDLGSMPPVIYKGKGCELWDPQTYDLRNDHMVLFYLLPPIQYPDACEPENIDAELPIASTSTCSEESRAAAIDIRTDPDYIFVKPKGKYYLKLGTSYRDTLPMETREDVKKWYCGIYPIEVKETIAKMKTLLTSILPKVHPLSVKGDTCTVALTPSSRPYIDFVSSNMAVAVGGNGMAAKSADEIGRLGSDLITTGEWKSGLSRDLFSVKFKK